ncbi:MAG: flagellar hook-associated protein FlgK [Chthoniobacteraceae bacterium]|nr:flagellar hook-associated protein FlgK [Chthoniobacteraceae bacterium]
MSGLIGALDSAAKSLATQSEGVQLAGKNLANANTPGYARQRLVIGSLGTVQTSVGAQSMGTQAVGIQQIRDQFLDAQMTREIAQTGFLQTQDENLLKAQADLGEQIDSTTSSTTISDTGSATSGISAAISGFFSAVEDVSATPSDTGAKQVLVEKADLLANKINVSDSRLASLQQDISAQNANDLGTVNDILKQVASLNGEIQKYELNAPGSAVDLRDERQSKLEELAQYMDFTAREIPDSHGQMEITAKGADGSDIPLVSKTNVLGGVSADDAAGTFTGGAPPKQLSLQGGSLEGNIQVRDGAIAQLRENLQAVANQLTDSVNKAYNPDGTGNNFFAAAPATGLIALDPTLSYTSLQTASNGDAGGSDLARAVAAVATRQFSTTGGDHITGTISGFYTKAASGFGQSVASVDSKLTDQLTVQSLIGTQRDSVSGVSQDEELTDLMKYQRGYQASARVLTVIDNLLDVVVNGLIK